MNVANLIVASPRDGLQLTMAGRKAAEAPSPPTGAELRSRVFERLDGPCQRLLAAILKAWPNGLTSDECAEKANYSPTTGSFKNAKSRLKTLDIIRVGAGGIITAQDWLFPGRK